MMLIDSRMISMGSFGEKIMAALQLQIRDSFGPSSSLTSFGR